MLTADHLLHATLSSEGFWVYRLECIEGRCPGISFTESSEGCKCEPQCEFCADDDHHNCVEFDKSIEGIGPECMCDEDDTECWTTSWLNECRGDCIHGDDWPEDVLPLPVHCEWSGDWMEIHYAPRSFSLGDDR